MRFAWLAVVLIGLLTSWYVAVMVALVNWIVLAMLAVANAGRAGQRDLETTRGAAGGGSRDCSRASCIPCQTVCRSSGQPGRGGGVFGRPRGDLVPPENSVVGRWWRANVDARPRSIPGETTLFAGSVAIGLGVIGLVALLTDRRVPRPGVGLSRARRGRIPAVARAVAAAAGRPRAGAIRLAGESAGLLGDAGAGPLRARRHAGPLGPDGAWGLSVAARAGRSGTLVLVVLIPMMLLEWFVVGFPGGKPEVHPIPAIYRTPEVRTARAIASLPEYRDRQDWFLGGDYLYYSTAHGARSSTGSAAADRQSTGGVAAVARSPRTRPQCPRWVCSTWSCTAIASRARTGESSRPPRPILGAVW